MQSDQVVGFIVTIVVLGRFHFWLLDFLRLNSISSSISTPLSAPDAEQVRRTNDRRLDITLHCIENISLLLFQNMKGPVV